MRSRVSRLRGPGLQFRFERGGGHLSLAARWPQAKFAEEPHSLHPVTGTWSRAPEQRRVFSLICVRTNAQAFGMAPSLNASPVDPQLWKFRVCQYCQRLDQLGCKYWELESQDVSGRRTWRTLKMERHRFAEDRLCTVRLIGHW